MNSLPAKVTSKIWRQAWKCLYLLALILLPEVAFGDQVPQSEWQKILLQHAVSLDLNRVQEFDNGVYAKVDQFAFFVTHKSQAPNDNRIYWTAVKVLSEKYGCFMREKENVAEEMVRFSCRDGRKIHFKFGSRNNLRYFFARQFDKFGRPILVVAAAH